jgi:hypothetical protein
MENVLDMLRILLLKIDLALAGALVRPLRGVVTIRCGA